MPSPPANAIALCVALSVGIIGLAATGCPSGGGERAAVERRLDKRPAAAVMSDLANARYVPPADGTLTDRQVRMYLDVKEREGKIREVAAARLRRRAAGSGPPRRGGKPPAEAAGAARDDLATADLRAAQELGVNPREYAWIKERIDETEVFAVTRALYQKMILGRDQLIRRMEREKNALTDPQQRAMAAREIEDWKKGLAGTEPVASPAVRANTSLIARYASRFARLQALEDRSLAGGAPAADGLAGKPAGASAAGAGKPIHP